MPYEKIGKEVRCIADEIPFDIPDSWEWVRLGNICNFGECINAEPGVIPDDAWVLDLEDIEKDTGRLLQIKTKKETKCTSTKHAFGAGQILYSKLRPYLNKVVIAPRSGFCTSEILPLRFYGDLFIPYVQRFLMSPGFVEYTIQCSYGVKMPRLGTEDGKAAFFPVPPLAEQKRIVAKIEELLPHIEEYDKAESKVSKLNTEFPDQPKKSILQWAIQGKLVQQNPNDEPARVLLERIRAEKAKLIKEGKIKKDKNESIIFRRDNSHYEKLNGIERCIDDEILFEIPDSWVWVRASVLGIMIRGKGIKRDETSCQGKPCIRYGEIYTTYNEVFTEKKSFIPEELDAECLHISFGDIVFTLTGENKVDIAKAVAFLGEGNVAAGGDLAYWTKHGMNPLYLVYYMASPFCIDQKRSVATGDIIVHISTGKVGNFLVPIPPLAEQQRIVKAIESVFKKMTI